MIAFVRSMTAVINIVNLYAGVYYGFYSSVYSSTLI